jgi:hypothetical protein
MKVSQFKLLPEAEELLFINTLQIFGKTIVCPIHLSASLVTLPPFVGLLGRDTVFEEFGFGFWEGTHELYVTGNP